MRENLQRRKSVDLSRIQDAGWKSRAVIVREQTAIPEMFRQLALRVRGEMKERDASTLLVTSALPQDGKTLVACNLALALASVESSHRIALADLDLRRPNVARSLGVETACGIEDVIRGRIPNSLVRISTTVGVDIYPVHEHVPSAHELLSRPELETFLKELASNHPIVVIDSPPLLPLPDGRQIISMVDACLVIARSGQTPQSALTDLAGQMPREKLIGSVLNDHRSMRRDYGYDRYYADAKPKRAADVGEGGAS